MGSNLWTCEFKGTTLRNCDFRKPQQLPDELSKNSHRNSDPVGTSYIIHQNPSRYCKACLRSPVWAVTLPSSCRVAAICLREWWAAYVCPSSIENLSSHNDMIGHQIQKQMTGRPNSVRDTWHVSSWEFGPVRNFKNGPWKRPNLYRSSEELYIMSCLQILEVLIQTEAPRLIRLHDWPNGANVDAEQTQLRQPRSFY